MEIILIAAVDKNLAIGKDGQIPWRISEDLRFFKEKTTKSLRHKVKVSIIS